MKSVLQRSLILSIALLLCFSTMLTNIFASDDPIGTITVNVEGLRIRKDADTNSDFIGGVQEGKTYDVYAVKNDGTYTWYQIQEGQWVADNGSWVTYTAAQSQSSSASNENTTSTNTSSSVYVKVDRLRIRTDASTSASVAGT